MTDNNKPRLIAIILTLLLALVLVTLLIYGQLTTTKISRTEEWPPQNHSEILFAEDYTEVFVASTNDAGDNVLEPIEGDGAGPSDVESDADTQLSHDLADASSTEGVNTNLSPSEQESPVQHKPVAKPGNRHPKDTATVASGHRQQKAEKNIETPGMARFSGKGNGTGSKNPNDRDGIAATDGTSGGKGLSMTANINQRPKSTKLGTIVVTCIVGPNGEVHNPQIASSGNFGDAAADPKLKAECLNAALKCQFAREKGGRNLPGTIYFTWR